MKGYKAFGKGLVCRGKQYAENTVFEEETAELCKSGIHFCENPLDCLDYYNLLDDEGNLVEIAEVEALDEALTDDEKKYCTKKLKIGAKLSLAGFIKASFDFLFEHTKTKRVKDSSKLAASGNYSQLAASGNYSQLAASGNYSKLAASGNYSKLAASGNYSQLAASGNYSKLAASGNYSQLAASGDSSKLAASGNYSKLAASGKNSVLMCAGANGKAKAKIGCWITLSEWKKIGDEWIPVCVKTERVDGARIKEDVFYQLIDGEFKEVT